MPPVRHGGRRAAELQQERRQFRDGREEERPDRAIDSRAEVAAGETSKRAALPG